MAAGVYEIRNVLNGRRYIGSAVDIEKRWKEHRRQLGAGIHHSRFLMRDWYKRGAQDFQFSVVLLCDRDMTLFYEQRCLDAFAPEYNTVKVAGSMLGYRHTPETRARLSAARRRNPSSPRKGMTHTPEARARISANRKGKGGGPRSQERLAKIGAAHRGKPKSAAHRAKIAAALRGSRTGRGSLTEEQVRQVRSLNATGLGYVRISRELGISPSAANAVIGGHAYLWVK